VTRESYINLTARLIHLRAKFLVLREELDAVQADIRNAWAELGKMQQIDDAQATERDFDQPVH
jgi:hypothetical protein